jgi:Transcriptional repressor TCF25
MDPSIPENAPFFSVLFRHMQTSCMLGCPSVAAEVGKLLLSLDPQGDRYHVLLSLDHYLTVSGKRTQLLDIMGLSAVDAGTRSVGVGESRDAEGGKGAAVGGEGTVGGAGVGEVLDRGALWSVEDTDFSTACFTSPLDIDQDRAHRQKQKQWEREREREREIHDQTEKEISASPSVPAVPVSAPLPLPRPLPQLRHLPNWWFSLALSTFIQEKAADTTATASSSSSSSNSSSKTALTSDDILLKVLSIWPYVLQPLLKRAGVQTGSSHWRYIFAHPFFATAPSRYAKRRGSSSRSSSRSRERSRK